MYVSNVDMYLHVCTLFMHVDMSALCAFHISTAVCTCTLRSVCINMGSFHSNSIDNVFAIVSAKRDLTLFLIFQIC